MIALSAIPRGSDWFSTVAGGITLNVNLDIGWPVREAIIGQTL
jgi:hypothetical protein